ncbi:phosphotransferase enzyme family protein [Mycobacterium xenopi 3993]|nr:phosphotransferase enzyme family protein [Mycobacterium xenopi 3993]
MQASLPAVLRPVLGADVAIENLRVLTGGASRSTWAFDAVTPSGRRSLILRTGAPDDMHAGMEREARVQAAAEAAGAPVPHILVATDSVAPLGNPFLICDEIKGETIVRRIDRQLERAGGAAVRAGCCGNAPRRWPPSTVPTRAVWSSTRKTNLPSGGRG